MELRRSQPPARPPGSVRRQTTNERTELPSLSSSSNSCSGSGDGAAAAASTSEASSCRRLLQPADYRQWWLRRRRRRRRLRSSLGWLCFSGQMTVAWWPQASDVGTAARNSKSIVHRQTRNTAALYGVYARRTYQQPVSSRLVTLAAGCRHLVLLLKDLGGSNHASRQPAGRASGRTDGQSRQAVEEKGSTERASERWPSKMANSMGSFLACMQCT